MSILEGIFRLVVSLTLAGSLGTLLVLGGKTAMKDRLSPGWSYLLWALPLALYLVPFALPAMGAASGTSAPSGDSPLPGSEMIPAAGELPATVPLPDLCQSLGGLWEQALPVLAWAWLLGLLFFGAVRLVDHHTLAQTIRRCSCPPREDGQAARIFNRLREELKLPQGKVELLLCPGLESPLLLGLLRPRILLPREDFPERQLAMMLRHELNHYRGKDLWYKGLALGTACIHSVSYTHLTLPTILLV